VFPEVNPPELRDVHVHVERIPRTDLVHVDVGDVGGLVLTRIEAARIGQQLITVAGLRASRGRADAAGGRAALGRSVARPS
jgi:hypothetical protein